MRITKERGTYKTGRALKKKEKEGVGYPMQETSTTVNGSFVRGTSIISDKKSEGSG